MFYVQNWDLTPQHSAFQNLQHQLVSIKKSLQHYDASPGAKKDSYLLTELSKVQKLAYIIQDNLTTLSANPKNSEASDFLVHGNTKQLPSLQEGMKIFDQLEVTVGSRVNQIQKQFDTLMTKVQDPKYKEFLGRIKEFSSDDTNIYGSRCGMAAIKIIDIYSKYINPKQLSEVKDMERLQRMQTSNTQVLNSFKEGAAKLHQDIAKDLKDGQHKLYFCSLDNGYFKDVGGWRHPHYNGHAFVVEKTPDDHFRLYQSYLNQYSLKSFLTNELKNHSDGHKEYEDIYLFLKDLKSLSHAKKWTPEVNEIYKNCFGVDHQLFLGEEISDNFFKLRYVTIDMQKEEYQAPKKEIEPLSVSVDDYKAVLDTATSAAIGSTVGVAVSGAIAVAYYTASSAFGLLL